MFIIFTVYVKNKYSNLKQDHEAALKLHKHKQVYVQVIINKIKNFKKK